MKGRATLAIAVATLVVAGCGATTAKPARYASTYPGDFTTTFGSHCRQAGGSAAMCSCATQGLENAVTYTTLQQTVSTIMNGTTDVPWWNRLQTACKRKGSGSPPYVAPNSLVYLAPSAPSAAAAPGSPPAAQVQQAVVAILNTCISHSYDNTVDLGPVSQATDTLIRFSHTYNLDAQMGHSDLKAHTLRQALAAARDTLRTCSPQDASRLDAVLGGS